MPQAELHPFFQKRFVCAFHGYFDVMTAAQLPDSFRPKCPSCRQKCEPREGYECSGKTATPLPHITKPRPEEVVEYQFPEYSAKGFRQARRKRA